MKNGEGKIANVWIGRAREPEEEDKKDIFTSNKVKKVFYRVECEQPGDVLIGFFVDDDLVDIKQITINEFDKNLSSWFRYPKNKKEMGPHMITVQLGYIPIPEFEYVEDEEDEEQEQNEILWDNSYQFEIEIL